MRVASLRLSRRIRKSVAERQRTNAPWVFVPKDNIKSISTRENPGLVTIWEAGRGKDVKGILEKPIPIDAYPPPWEFHLGLVQNTLAMKGLSEEQINYAIGLNLALTFSDPAGWPRDRTRLPPQTHSTQLFVVHLGNIGENYRQGRFEGHAQAPQRADVAFFERVKAARKAQGESSGA